MRGERRNVADRRQEPRLTVVDHRSGTARCGRDHGHAGGERLDRNDRGALVRRRQEKRVECGVPRAEVVDVAEKPNALVDAEGPGELLDLSSELSVSGQHQHRVGQKLQHANQITGTLDLGQPPGPTDHERVAEPGCGASSLTGLRRRVDPSVEVESVRDDDELGSRRDAEAHEVVTYLVAHRDECVGRVRKRTFREPIRPLAPRGEVPTQDVAVVGVHDCTGTRAAGNERGHAAGGAGFRGVRVQDVRPALAQQPVDRSGRRGIVPRRDLTPQFGDMAIGHAELLREVLHRRLAGRDRPGDDQHVMPESLLSRRELEHRERSAADVQAGDRVHDPHLPEIRHAALR